MGSSLLPGLTPVVVSEGCSPAVACVPLLALASLVVESAGPGLVGLVVVAHRLSCPLIYGIFVGLGSNPCPLH